MDVIINLIVTVAIVLFILRRMQEVAQKGRDITAPPVPQTMFGDDEEMSDEETAPPRRRYPVSEEPAPIPPRRFAMPTEEPAPRRWSPPPVPTARRIHIPDEDLLERLETVVSASPARRPGPGAGRMAAMGSGLPSEEDGDSNGVRPEYFGISFGRRGLVQGIVMREILGPPMGIRSSPGGINS